MSRRTQIRIQRLFNNLTLSFSQHKTGLVGRNGIGKSRLLKAIMGELYPPSGTVQVEGKIGYVPQNPHIDPSITIAEFLGFEIQLWFFGLEHIPYTRTLNSLSGGEITRLFLTKAFFSDADFLVLDEPTNHLDNVARKQLYDAIKKWPNGMIVVSHDRTLLNLMDEIVELNTLGADCYGGNYEFYLAQKTLEKDARNLALHDAKKLLGKTKNSIQGSREKHSQKQSYGLKLKKIGSIDKMAAGSKKGRSERTQSKLLIKEERLLNQAKTQIKTARDKIELIDDINIALPNTYVPNGKIIVDIDNMTFSYPETNHPIIANVSFTIQGPERIALAGANGSGKTTLVKLLLGELTPQQGKIYIGTEHVSYLDQTMSLLNPELSILENFLFLNPDASEYNAYQALAQFLFKNVTALKLVKELSGGEKLRALLACVLLSKKAPQLLILDEPTNHLDLNSIQNLESALKCYQGALLVISHDHAFLENIGIIKTIQLR